MAMYIVASPLLTPSSLAARPLCLTSPVYCYDNAKSTHISCPGPPNNRNVAPNHR